MEAGGLPDAKMTAEVAYLKGACHTSYSTMQDLLRDLLGMSISRGQLAKTVEKASEAPAEPYAELERRLPQEPHVNVDETGHKDPEQPQAVPAAKVAPETGTAGNAAVPPRANPWWTWVFRCDLFTLFKSGFAVRHTQPITASIRRVCRSARRLLMTRASWAATASRRTSSTCATGR